MKKDFGDNKTHLEIFGRPRQDLSEKATAYLFLRGCKWAEARLRIYKIQSCLQTKVVTAERIEDIVANDSNP